MKNITLYILLVAGILSGCQHKSAFTVAGHITGAEGDTLYLEHTALLSTTTVDSCVIKANEEFTLKGNAPAYPDFYRLRLGKQSLLLAVDSTETITINTTCDSLPFTLDIQGSQQSLDIAQLRAAARNCTREELRAAALQQIAANPRSLAAYHALFLKQAGEPIWDINNNADRRMYQAVATSYNLWMPDYERTVALYTQVNNALNAERSILQQQALQHMITNAENAFLDITLNDDKGVPQSLSKHKGKVIVLDFSAIDMERSQAYIFELRELYNRYHQRGMAIYSVSLDRNKLLWEDGVANLPWTNVYAGEKTFEVLTRYNVQSLPTLFLLDRKGNVQGRYIDFKALETDIKKYL